MLYTRRTCKPKSNQINTFAILRPPGSPPLLPCLRVQWNGRKPHAVTVYQAGDRFCLSSGSLATFATNRERVVRERRWGVRNLNATVRKMGNIVGPASETRAYGSADCARTEFFLGRSASYLLSSSLSSLDVFPVPRRATLHALLTLDHRSFPRAWQVVVSSVTNLCFEAFLPDVVVAGFL